MALYVTSSDSCMAECEGWSRTLLHCRLQTDVRDTGEEGYSCLYIYAATRRTLHMHTVFMLQCMCVSCQYT